jgi:hypothetical protein
MTQIDINKRLAAKVLRKFIVRQKGFCGEKLSIFYTMKRLSSGHIEHFRATFAPFGEKGVECAIFLRIFETF